MTTKKDEKSIRVWLKTIDAKTIEIGKFKRYVRLRDSNNKIVAKFKLDQTGLSKLKHGITVPPICIYKNLSLLKNELSTYQR